MDSKTDTPLAREEWDFTSCPDDRTYFCYTYEYAREVPALVAKFRDEALHGYTFDILGQWHHVFLRKDLSGKDGWPEVIDAPPGFPEKPYLLTDHFVNEYSRRPVTKLEHPLKPVVINPDQTFQVNLPTDRRELSPDQLSVFQVNWLFSNKALVADFARWVRANRGDRKPIEFRGRNEVAECQSDLKNLGALRLIRHFGSQPAAAAYTESLGLKGNLKLFSEPSRWYKAKADAEEILAEWSKATADDL
jgi:hypothetical protein